MKLLFYFNYLIKIVDLFFCHHFFRNPALLATCLFFTLKHEE